MASCGAVQCCCALCQRAGGALQQCSLLKRLASVALAPEAPYLTGAAGHSLLAAAPLLLPVCGGRGGAGLWRLQLGCGGGEHSCAIECIRWPCCGGHG